MIVAAALAVIAGTVLGVVLYQNSKGPTGNYTLSGSAKGKGLNFFVPAQLQVEQDSSNNVKFFGEYYPGSQNTKTTLAVATATLANSANTASQISNALKSPASSSFFQFSSLQGTLMRNLAASGPLELNLSDVAANQMTIQSIKPFKNKHIKSNAWRLNFTTTRPSPKDQQITVDGTLIYAIGKKAYYRLLVSSVHDNWQANQATWNKITDSLSIDR